MRVPFTQLTLRRVLILLIIGGASIAVPMAVGRIREGELRDSCGACLRQVGSAVVGYRSNHSDVYPPGTVLNSGLPPERRLSWVTLLYGYFDESQNVHFLFDTTAPWDSKRNRVPVIRSDNLDDENTFTD